MNTNVFSFDFGKGSSFQNNSPSTNSVPNVLEIAINGVNVEVDLSLKSIDLIRRSISSKEAKLISEALATHPYITKLYLSNSSIGDEGAKWLAEALKHHPSLSVLELDYNQVHAEGAKWIAESLGMNNSLTTVNLRGNSIGSEGTKWIAKSLKENQTLTHLDLGNNAIGPEGAKWIAELLQINSSITKLDLSSNYINSDGALQIIEASKINHFITDITINSNRIDANTIKVLENVLQNRTSVKTASTHNKKQEATIYRLDPSIELNADRSNPLNTEEQRSAMPQVMIKDSPLSAKPLIFTVTPQQELQISYLSNLAQRIQWLKLELALLEKEEEAKLKELLGDEK